jgi:hypothetical protein
MAPHSVQLAPDEPSILPDITNFVSYDLSERPVHMTQNSDVFKGTYRPAIGATHGTSKVAGLFRVVQKLLSFSPTYTQRRSCAVAVKVFRLHVDDEERMYKVRRQTPFDSTNLFSASLDD